MDFKQPNNYSKNNIIGKSNFTKGLMSKDRERFDKSVKGITLASQIDGESLPSRVDTHVNAQAIMFISVAIDNIKNASFVASIIQKATKALAVVTVTDKSGSVILSFATKRLNENDHDEIVIEDIVTSPKFNNELDSKFKSLAQKYLQHDAILNTADKYAFYIEMATKCYIISHPTLFNGMLELLNSKVWYNTEATKELLHQLKTLDHKKQEAKSATEIADQMRLGGEIKQLLEEIKKYG